MRNEIRAALDAIANRWLPEDALVALAVCLTAREAAPRGLSLPALDDQCAHTVRHDCQKKNWTDNPNKLSGEPKNVRRARHVQARSLAFIEIIPAHSIYDPSPTSKIPLNSGRCPSSAIAKRRDRFVNPIAGSLNVPS